MENSTKEKKNELVSITRGELDVLLGQAEAIFWAGFLAGAMLVFFYFAVIHGS